MALLISLHDISKSFGSQKLFSHLCLSLNEGDRMGLGGPNGAGKSTLLKIVFGLENSDEGHVAKKQGLKVSYAGQFPEFPEKSIEEVLMLEVPELDPEDARIRANILLDKAKFTNFNVLPSSLSGGWKKRLDIVRAWMKEPDLVLLDEPTNHLDLEGIDWLESFLKKEKAAYLIVSHDRRFLQNICTKVAEINQCFPEGVFVSKGNWSTFLEKKEEFLKGQQERERSLAGTVRDEVDWLRKSPKARTSKSKSRIQKAHNLIDELQSVRQRNVVQKAQVQFSASERETRNLLVASNVSKTLGGKLLFRSVDIKLSPGTRLGIVGKNGTGKTTLLKTLAGEIPQDLGTIKYAQDVSLVYFDQHRESLDPKETLKEALSPHGDFVKFHSQEIHVNGWAKKFLFPSDRLNMPVGNLSGGEKARILMARLMLKPADVLFLDEPTNDLDIPTLEVIEESLLDFPGAVVLITHDRYLMSKICTQILALGEGEQPKVYADYAQWESAEKETVKEEVFKKAPVSKKEKKKLSYNEQKELLGMEENILSLEEKIASLALKAEEPEMQSNSVKQLEIYEKMGSSQKKLEELYERWQFLLDASKE
jgi:ABC transport system ATP-binding/permease protein